jgi:hypothetical protein
VCVVVFASERASFTGLDNVEGWVPVVAVGQDVSMIVPILGEQGLMVCLEVIAGCSIALRFLEFWPKTFVVGHLLLLMYDGRLFWLCYMYLLGLISPRYPHCLLF